MNAFTSTFAKWQNGSQKRTCGAIGLHCTINHIHMVQMAFDGEGNPSLNARASIPFEVSRATSLKSYKNLRLLIRTALKSASFQKGQPVVSCLPASDTTIMSVNYRVNAGHSETAAIMRVMAERLSGPISNYVIDYQKIRSTQEVEGNERLALVAVAEHSTVVEYLEVLRKCSLAVERLEVGPIAIHRLVSALCSQNNFENAIAINFGQEASYLTVVSGRRLLLDQKIPLGENNFLDDIAKTLETSKEAARDLVKKSSFRVTGEQDNHSPIRYDSELSTTLKEIVKPRFLQLVEEINRTLIYVASLTRGEPVKRIFLLGSLAYWSGVDEYLNSLVQLDVEAIANPLELFEREQTSGSNTSAEIAVATGLALGGMNS